MYMYLPDGDIAILVPYAGTVDRKLSGLSTELRTVPDTVSKVSNTLRGLLIALSRVELTYNRVPSGDSADLTDLLYQAEC
jgi:hypothetical protein